MKKTKATLVALSVLVALSAFGCSDDEDSNERVIGARCTPVSFRYNGTDCQNNNVIACENNRVTEYVCANGCEIVNNEASCIGGGGSGCGNVTADGMCIGKTLKYCEDDQVKSKVCEVSCGEVRDADGVYYDCINDGPVGECGNVSELGECNGSVARICVSGKLHERDCSQEGLVCQTNASSGRVDCINLVKPPVGECGNIDELGVCDGNTLKYCENGSLKTRVCPVACGDKVDDDGITYKACIDDAPVNECGNIDEKGVCNGKIRKYCDNGKLKSENCPVACGEKDDGAGNKIFACIDDAPVNECGDIDALGVCEGKTLKYCGSDNKLVVNDCDIACGEVVDEEEGNYWACLDCSYIQDLGICTDDGLVYCEDDEPVYLSCDNGCKVASTEFAYCFEPCGDVDARGVCAEDNSTVQYCDSTNMLITMYCNEGSTCGEVQDEHGEIYYDCR